MREFLPKDKNTRPTEQSTEGRSFRPPQAKRTPPAEEAPILQKKEESNQQYSDGDSNGGAAGAPSAPSDRPTTPYVLPQFKQEKKPQIPRFQLPLQKKEEGTAPSHTPFDPTAIADPAAVLPWIVADTEKEIQAGQIKKSAFLSKLKQTVTAKSEAALAGTDWTAKDCPAIEKWIAHFQGKSSAFIEKEATKYGIFSKATNDPQKNIDTIADSVAGTVQGWVLTKKVSGFTINSLYPPAQKDVQAAKEKGIIQQKENNSTTNNSSDPQQVQGQLNGGNALDSATRNKMEGAFGSSFSDVKIHTDSKAAQLSSNMGARAFTVGQDVAFGQGQYQPGTMVGDALLAHELAHVQQQKNANTAVQAKAAGNYNALEEDADNSAVGVVSQLWGKGKKWAKNIGKEAMPRLKSGLQLQRCGNDFGYSTTKRILENERHTFSGDQFAIALDWETIHSNNSNHLAVELNYKGNNLARQDGVKFLYDFYKDYGIPDPKITEKKGNIVKIDLFNDGKFIVQIEDKIRYNKKWSPAGRIHDFEVYGNTKKMGQISEVEIIDKSAIPTKVTDQIDDKAVDKHQAEKEAIDIANPVEALKLAKIRLEALFASYKPKSIDEGAWAVLYKQIDSDIKSLEKGKGSLSKAEEDKFAAKANFLESSALETASVLENLEKLANKKLYLDDIADSAVGFVHGVQGKFELALRYSYGKNKTATAIEKAAQKALIGLPYQIAGLYLKRGSGIDGLASQMGQLKSHYQYFRSKNGGGNESRPIEQVLQLGDNHIGVQIPENIHKKTGDLRKKFFNNAEGVLQEIFELTQDMSQYMGAYSILTMHEQFVHFDDKIPWLTSDSATRKAVKSYRAKFKGYIDKMEPALQKRGTNPDGAKAAIASVVPSFSADVSKKEFGELIAQVQKDIKQMETVKVVAKVLVIVGAAALTGGAAGAAMGAALEGAGIGGAIAFGAVTFTEALVFTATSSVMEKVVDLPSDTSFGEDLLTNMLMFGFLRKAGSYYQKIGVALQKTGNLRLAKIMEMSGSKFAFSLGSLQTFAYAHHLVKEGKPMTGKEFGQSLLMNTVLMSALHMGRFITGPLNARVESGVRDYMTKNFSGQLSKLTAERVALRKQLAQIDANRGTAAEKLPETLARMRELTQAELKLVVKAGKAKGKTGAQMQEMVQKYEAKIAEAELKLAQLGVESTPGNKTHFRELSNGTIVYKDGQKAEVKQILESFYKEYNGVIVEKGGNFIGKMGGETTIYLPESIASKAGLVGAGIARTKDSTAALEYIKSRLPKDAREGLERLMKDVAKPKDGLLKLQAAESSGKNLVDFLTNYKSAKTKVIAFPEIADKVTPNKDGTGFKLNRKKVQNAHKIIGDPEATVKMDAAREAYAAELAARRANVKEVHLGENADSFINPGRRLGQEMSADVVAVTNKGKYYVSESKGKNIVHGLEQLEYTGNQLGKEKVLRYELVIPEEVQVGYKITKGKLQVSDGKGGFNDVLINGKPVFVTRTKSK